MNILKDPYGAGPFVCDGRVNNRFYLKFLERFIWEQFQIHPCDQEETYKTAGYSVLTLLALIFFITSPWIFAAARRQISSITTAAPGLLHRLGVSMFEFLLNTAAFLIVLLLWLRTQLPQLFMARFNNHWAHWMPPPPEPTAAPEPVAEAPTAAAAGPEAGRPTPVTPPDANLFPLPTLGSHLAPQQGRTMRDIENSRAGSSSRHAVRPMIVVGQTQQERDLSKLHRFCETLRDEQLLFKDTLQEILVETRDLTNANKELMAAIDEDAISKSVKTAVFDSTKDLNARVVAAVANAFQLSSTSAGSEMPSKSSGPKTDSTKYEAKIKSLEAALRDSTAREKDATASFQQKLAVSQQALGALEGELNDVREALVHKDASLKAYQNEWNKKLALKDVEVVCAQEAAMKKEQALEETKSVLATKTAELEAANESLATQNQSATRDSLSVAEATKASKAVFETQLLESRGRETSLAENTRKMEQANGALQKQVEDLMAQIQESKPTSNDDNAQIQLLQNSLQLSNQKIAELEEHNSALMTEGQALLKQRNELDTRNQAVQKERDEFLQGGHALDNHIKGVQKVCQEQALQISKLQQELNGSRRHCETFGTQTADLQEKLKSTQEAGRQAVALAVRERDATIAELRAKLQAPQHNTPAAASTPFSQAKHSALFSSGPKRLPPSPITEHSRTILALSKQVEELKEELIKARDGQALQDKFEAMAAELDRLTEEKNDALKKAEEQTIAVSSLEEQRDTARLAVREAGHHEARVSMKGIEQQKKIDDLIEKLASQTRMNEELNLSLQRAEGMNVFYDLKFAHLANSQSNNSGPRGKKRLADDDLLREDDLKKTRELRFPTLAECFPNGYRLIQTSGEGFMCGLRAMVSSVQAQHPNIEPVTFENLEAQIEILSWTRETSPFGPLSTNNFRADELAILLHDFYESEDLNVHLGIVQPGRAPWVIPGGHDHKADRLIVWIYNDQARETARSRGINPDAPGHEIFNHYQGIEHIHRPATLPVAPTSDTVSVAPYQPPPSQSTHPFAFDAMGTQDSTVVDVAQRSTTVLTHSPTLEDRERSRPRTILNTCAPRGKGNQVGSPSRPRMQKDNPFAVMSKPGPMQTDGADSEISIEEGIPLLSPQPLYSAGAHLTTIMCSIP